MFEQIADGLFRDHVDVAAGIVEPTAFQHHITDTELPPDKVVERHVACGEVAPMFLRIQHDVMVAKKRLQCLHLDQGDLTHIRLSRVGAGVDALCIAIACDADPRDQFSRVMADHGRARLRCRMNAQ